DRGTDNFATHADRTAHGGEPFLAWWLGQVAGQDRKRGSRTLDYLDVHWYPQGQGVLSNAADPATQALRIRSTRDLWDPSYTDESWIGTQTDLIPRLRSWIDQDYPGTKLAITEYGWGGEHDASGAVALAEVLGTFGRQGVDLATYWMYPPPQSPAGAAFRLYRNYDGRDGSFGDISVPVTVDQAGVRAYAARHSGSHELDVMLTNESPDQQATVHLSTGSGSATDGDAYQVAGDGGQIQHRSLSGGTVVLPPYSVTLVRLGAAG
ncbi:MAG: endoglucanase, partial [Candidatus Dormibacteraeota bacterium]|nr:endoglucanase [Candidatus Dormibacteraeota bacterium]